MYIICPTQPVKVSFPGGVILEGLKIFAFFRYYPDFSFLIYLQCKNTSAKLVFDSFTKFQDKHMATKAENILKKRNNLDI